MGNSSGDLVVSLLELDRSILEATDFHALGGALVKWAHRVGLADACVVAEDEQGTLRPVTSSGHDIKAHADEARRATLDPVASDTAPAYRAWQLRRIQTASPSGNSSESAASQGCEIAWVPLAHEQTCVGLLCLYSAEIELFAQPEWAAALAHIALIAGVALDRMHLNIEQSRLRELSLQDALTGLPNMTALSLHLEQATARASRAEIPLVIGLLDLDKFKPINDLFGHEVGDDVLREIASRLREEIRTSDFVARRSGDEFVITLEGVRDPEHTLPPLLERLHARLTSPVTIGQMSLQCGISLGLSVWPDPDAVNTSDPLSQADRALRSIKTRTGEHQNWWGWASSDDARENRSTLDRRGADPYDPAWAPEMASLSAQLERNAAAIVEEFYRRLSRLTHCKQILDALDESELQHLKAQQIRNLFSLADPGLTEEAHRVTALRVGRIHAMVGLNREELVRCRGILSAAVDRHLARSVSREATQIFARRLNRDLAFQSEAYQRLEDERREALSRIARVTWSSESYADLIAQIVDILGSCDEVAGCSITRPDGRGVFRVESAKGRILAGPQPEFEADGLGLPRDLPLPTAAWHTGKIVRSVSISTDENMAVLRPVARRLGLRSSVSIPLLLSEGIPFAILTLHSAFPGGFSSIEQEAFIDLLQTLLALAIGRFASDEGTASAIPESTRRRWRALLRTDALQMHCQPIVDLRTGRVIKVEMLARLAEGSRLLTPYEFFPALRPDDFLELYKYGLNFALSQREKWLRTGFDLAVSLNLPSSALLDIRYFEATRDALAEHGSPAHRLTLELLESEALPRDAGITFALERFMSLGVIFAEDDLGSGHSSLSRLRELPFDWIKIDRSIVKFSGQDVATVLSFIYQLTRLGHSLGKSVIVEGVESEALLEACRLLNVDAAQGYVIAKPMPVDDLTAWMVRRSVLANGAHRPTSSLGKVAQLLMWEERLHLAEGQVRSDSHFADVERTHYDSRREPMDETLSATFSLEGLFGSLFPHLDTGLVHDAVMVRELVNTAHQHGLRSGAYHAARQRFVSALNC
ncbi:EAL domain-containing protein [Paraburkholderia dinghuensis]|nr:EAL domain-containing protein [Paraburkholderia dinghuensis]